MTHQAPLILPETAADPGRQVASLRELLALVRSIAGDGERAASGAALDEAARISSAYERASPVARRRFDAAAAETAAWAAAGVEALLAAGGSSSGAAARRLGDRLGDALDRLGRILPR